MVWPPYKGADDREICTEFVFVFQGVGGEGRGCFYVIFLLVFYFFQGTHTKRRNIELSSTWGKKSNRSHDFSSVEESCFDGGGGGGSRKMGLWACQTTKRILGKNGAKQCK